MADDLKFRITYQPFTTSDATSSDIVIHAQTAEEAELRFKGLNTSWAFIKADRI